MKFYEIDNFPTWALNYAMNGVPIEDDDDQKTVSKYINQLCVDLGWRWVDFCLDEDTDIHFCHHPEFGLACDCIKVVAYTD